MVRFMRCLEAGAVPFLLEAVFVAKKTNKRFFSPDPRERTRLQVTGRMQRFSFNVQVHGTVDFHWMEFQTIFVFFIKTCSWICVSKSSNGSQNDRAMSKSRLCLLQFKEQRLIGGAVLIGLLKSELGFPLTQRHVGTFAVSYLSLLLSLEIWLQSFNWISFACEDTIDGYSKSINCVLWLKEMFYSFSILLHVEDMWKSPPQHEFAI